MNDTSDMERAVNHDADAVRSFVARARSVINRRRLWHVFAWASVGVSLLTVCAGLAVIVTGARVPVWVYFVSIATLLTATVVAWMCVRADEAAAAKAIDRSFGLEDGVVTAVNIERVGAGQQFGPLQVRWARERTSSLNVGAVAARLHPGLIAAAILCPILAVSLGFVPESSAVVADRERRAAIAALAQELNEGLREEVEKAIEDAEEEELEELEPSELRELVDELDVSGEEAELLRQYGELERELDRRVQEKASPAAERLLDQAAASLAESPETARLGEALEQKRFDDAAKELEKFEQTEQVDQSQLEAKRKEMEKLSQLARRLSEAARKHEAASASARQGRQSDGKPSEGQQGEGKNSKSSAQPGNKAGEQASRKAGKPGERGQDGELSEQAAEAGDDAEAIDEELLEDIRELEEALEELEESMGECEGGQCSQADLDKLARASSSANKSLSKLRAKMKKMSAKQRAQSKLSSLRQSLAQCQSAVAGLGTSPFAGGRQAGMGSVDSSNQSETPEGGIAAELSTDVRAQGPARTTIEEAASGDGVAGRGSARTPEDFKRQLESFIERPDVPETVKDGVRNYLENIHRPADEDAGQAGAQGS